MAEDSRTVGIVVARRALIGPWQSHQWLPVAVLPAAPAVAPWTALGRSGADETFYAGAFEIALFAAETAHYRDNLAAVRPSIWVALRPGADDAVEVVGVTADPYEGESFAESVGDVVEALPMPDDIRAWIADFFAARHVERAFFKRTRDRFDPARRGRGAPRPAGDDE